MEKTEIIYLPKARRSIKSISQFINDKGYPETAEKFANKLYDFGDSLGSFPDKFPLCRHNRLVHFNYRCALFNENFIFVYRFTKTAIIIINVIHTSLLK